MQTKQEEQAPPLFVSARDVIVDTNIADYFFKNEVIRDQINSYLKEAADLGYGIAMSEITLFEMIDGLAEEKETTVFNTINLLKRYPVAQEVLIAAGRLGCFYKNLDIEGVSVADKIVAVTAILKNSLIYTANGRHFPQPFFKEIARRLITYNDKHGNPLFIVSYFIEPDFTVLNKYYSERFEAIKKSQEAAIKQAEKG